jgi:hypothetical protein
MNEKKEIEKNVLILNDQLKLLKPLFRNKKTTEKALHNQLEILAERKELFAKLEEKKTELKAFQASEGAFSCFLILCKMGTHFVFSVRSSGRKVLQ